LEYKSYQKTLLLGENSKLGGIIVVLLLAGQVP